MDLANGVIQSFSNERSQENERSIQNLVGAFTKLEQEQLHHTFSGVLGASYEGRKRSETRQSLGAALKVVHTNAGKSLLNKLQGQVKKNPNRFKNAMKKKELHEKAVDILTEAMSNIVSCTKAAPDITIREMNFDAFCEKLNK